MSIRSNTQENNFQKLRNYYLKHYPEMSAMYLDMGSIITPRVYIEETINMTRQINPRKSKEREPRTEFRFTRELVPKRLIIPFILALSEKE